MNEIYALIIGGALLFPVLRSAASLSTRALVRACLCRKDKPHEC